MESVSAVRSLPDLIAEIEVNEVARRAVGMVIKGFGTLMTSPRLAEGGLVPVTTALVETIQELAVNERLCDIVLSYVENGTEFGYGVIDPETFLVAILEAGHWRQASQVTLDTFTLQDFYPPPEGWTGTDLKDISGWVIFNASRPSAGDDDK